jgi:uncharacterized membrane protein
LRRNVGLCAPEICGKVGLWCGGCGVLPMDMLVLAALVVLAIPIGLVWVIVSHSGLSRRVRNLEAEVATLRAATVLVGPEGRAAAPPAPMPVVSTEVALPAESAAPLLAEVGGSGTSDEDTPPDHPPAAAPPPLPPRRPDPFDRLGLWLRDNWVYAVAAVSLAAAGAFLVQYGMERGLLPPGLRVLAGIVFGLALIGAGEVIRRRYGDGPAGTSASLPSVFSGAGLVSVFAALLAGRLMYGLIGPEVTFVGLVLTALGAIVLGWLHGPLLAALGLVGATLAPFLTGGASEAPAWLMAHFALVAALGLGIDTLRRWGWVSVLALVLAYAGGLLAMSAGAGEVAYLILAVALVPLTIAIPARGKWPDQSGPSLVDMVVGGLPTFPMRLAMGVMLATGAILALLPLPDAGTTVLAFALTAGLVVALLIWTDRAPALHDLALIPAAAFLARFGLEGLWSGPLWDSFTAATPEARGPEVAAPLTLTVVLALAALITAALALRSKRGTAHPVVMAAGAALVVPLAALAAEFLWRPASILGPYLWALQVIALAALMVGQAAMMARLEGDDPRRRTAHAALSALVLIGLALFILTTKASLTLALALMVTGAAYLDRRFRLPELSWALMAGVVLIGYRLTLDPGIVWALEAPLLPVLMAFLGSAFGFAAAQWAIRGMGRYSAWAFLESGLAATLALLVNVLLLRWLKDGSAFLTISSLALPWLVLALVQMYRLHLGGPLHRVRLVVGGIAGAFAALGLGWAVVFNPVLGEEVISGPLILDTLFVAYALPGLILLASLRAMGHLPPRWTQALTGAGAVLTGLYLLLEIRRFWRGDDLSVRGTSQAELYTYTVVMLILGAVLLWRAITTGSQTLRRAAMAVIGLTAAKVFLIDASGLSGLVRVFSFLALGLSLAGLAALNRWAASRSGPERTPLL